MNELFRATLDQVPQQYLHPLADVLTVETEAGPRNTVNLWGAASILLYQWTQMDGMEQQIKEIYPELITASEMPVQKPEQMLKDAKAGNAMVIAYLTAVLHYGLENKFEEAVQA